MTTLNHALSRKIQTQLVTHPLNSVQVSPIRPWCLYSEAGHVGVLGYIHHYPSSQESGRHLFSPRVVCSSFGMAQPGQPGHRAPTPACTVGRVIDRNKPVYKDARIEQLALDLERER